MLDTKLTLSVFAGLIAGIAMVVVFAVSIKPADTLADDELRKLAASQYPQFQALKERYPNTTVEDIQRYNGIVELRYDATKDLLMTTHLDFRDPECWLLYFLFDLFLLTN
jgi:hypothetical protein